MSEEAPRKKAAKKKAAKPRATRKKSEPKQETEQTEAPAPAVKLGPSPHAVVLSRYEGDMHERRGKGFSFGELASVGLNKVMALGLGVPVDIRRRSTLEGNVSALKGWYQPPLKKAKEPRAESPKPAKTKKKKKAAKKPAKKEEA